MLEVKLPVPSPTPDPVPHLLPQVFRIATLTRRPATDGRSVRNEAVLFHAKASLRVVWVTGQIDTRLQAGHLVSIRWLGKPVSVEGAIRINRLVLLERSIPCLDLFETIPSNWVKEDALLKRASAIWQHLASPFQQLFNTIFWDSARLHRYLAGPSSLNGHHNGFNGNFRHSVETAEQCLTLAQGNPNISRSVLLTAALLHDAGKADEYKLHANRRSFTMSDRGALVGHRHTILEWIAVAKARDRVILPESHYLALLHALTAAKGAEWLGIREPVSLEATILSAADRLSGQADLVSRMAPDDVGFGGYHKHLKGRPYVVGEVERVQAVALIN
jgi:3'-5' exoribonuclease